MRGVVGWYFGPHDQRHIDMQLKDQIKIDLSVDFNPKWDQYKDMDMRQLLLAYIQLREIKAAIAAKLAEINKSLEFLSQGALPEMMDEVGEGATTLTFDNFARITIKADLRCSAKKGKVEDVKDFLLEEGADSLIKDTVNASSLLAWVKGRIKEGKEVPPDLFNLHPFRKASVTSLG